MITYLTFIQMLIDGILNSFVDMSIDAIRT